MAVCQALGQALDILLALRIVANGLATEPSPSGARICLPWLRAVTNPVLRLSRGCGSVCTVGPWVGGPVSLR